MSTVSIYEEVKYLVRIEDTIQAFSGVELNKKGTKLFGTCPFHEDKSPSLAVYPNKNDFYCFGCGTGGDSISFVEKLLNITSFEAAKAISDRFNVNKSIDVNLISKINSIKAKYNQAKLFQEECTEKYKLVVDTKKHIEDLARQGIYTTPVLVSKTIHLEGYLDILLFGNDKDKLHLLNSKDIDKNLSIISLELKKCKEKGEDWTKQIFVERNKPINFRIHEADR
ncbi:MAG: hypothetical protein APF76_04800 [Desulfitibacter sp. BRH_c19]|nr:MAG: hypothetical protein APF76_04800 [Desulfitibacter sp. BRH_c19]